MKIAKLLRVALISTISLSGLAKNFIIEGQEFSIDIPKTWQSSKNLLGAHLSLLGPYKNKRRSVISIDASPLERFVFDEVKLKESQSEYKRQRLEFLKKSNGKAIKFYPYKKVHWNSIKDIHTIGYYYSALDNNFHERNYFFNCKKKLYSLSTLMTDDQLKRDRAQLKEILNSIVCK